MIDGAGEPRVVEYNARLGDPEAQVLLMRLKSDLFELLWAATEGSLALHEPQWDRHVALGVVLAAAGYPLAPRKGDAITVERLPADDCVFFHAGTAIADDGTLATSGGRVICVTALGESVRTAQGRAYEGVRAVHFAGAQWRGDIGHRAIKPRGP
jgi:phosphoribosylamine--glycine ligase